jgi:hypothetical protein
MRTGSATKGLGTAGCCLALGLLVTGCGAQHPAGGTGVVVGNGGLTPPPAATRSVNPSPQGAAATPGGPCPTLAQWMNRTAPTSDNGTPANTPAAEELSQAIGAAGRQAAFADVYGSQVTDFPVGRVALCVTDLAAGHRLAAEAKRIDPRVDLSRLDLYLSRYSAAHLSAAAQRLAALMPKGALGFPVNAVATAPDASGVEVDTNAAGVASPAFKQHLEQLTGGIPVTLVNRGPAVPA